MGDKFQYKYRIESIRMLGWNFGWKGFYYVIWPNHIHGIVRIGRNQFNNTTIPVSRDAMHGVSTPSK